MSLQDCEIKRLCNERRDSRIANEERGQKRVKARYQRRYDRTNPCKNRYKAMGDVTQVKINVIHALNLSPDEKYRRIQVIKSQGCYA